MLLSCRCVACWCVVAPLRLQAMLLLEQERHASLSKDTQLALVRQRLRQDAAPPPGTAASGAASNDGSMGRVLGQKRPHHSIDDWEELIDEAASDLEQLECQMREVAERLVALQAQGVQAAGQAAQALQAKAEAEQQEQAAKDRLQVGGVLGRPGNSSFMPSLCIAMVYPCFSKHNPVS